VLLRGLTCFSFHTIDQILNVLQLPSFRLRDYDVIRRFQLHHNLGDVERSRTETVALRGTCSFPPDPFHWPVV
jgi:hypothetical protein